MLTQSWGTYRASGADLLTHPRAITQPSVRTFEPSEAEVVLALSASVAEAETKLALAISVARARGTPLGDCLTVAGARDEVACQRAALDAVRVTAPAASTRPASLPSAGKIALKGLTAANIALYRRTQNAA
jgi:hypothetical protein